MMALYTFGEGLHHKVGTDQIIAAYVTGGVLSSLVIGEIDLENLIDTWRVFRMTSKNAMLEEANEQATYKLTISLLPTSLVMEKRRGCGEYTDFLHAPANTLLIA